MDKILTLASVHHVRGPVGHCNGLRHSLSDTPGILVPKQGCHMSVDHAIADRPLGGGYFFFQKTSQSPFISQSPTSFPPPPISGVGHTGHSAKNGSKPMNFGKKRLWRRVASCGQSWRTPPRGGKVGGSEPKNQSVLGWRRTHLKRGCGGDGAQLGLSQGNFQHHCGKLKNNARHGGTADRALLG